MTADKEAEKIAKKKLICYTRFTMKLFHMGKGDVHVLWRRQNNKAPMLPVNCTIYRPIYEYQGYKLM